MAASFAARTLAPVPDQKVVSTMSILICYDGSGSAKRSLTVAEKTLDGAQAVLLHVFNPPERVLADAFSTRESDQGPSYETLEKADEQRAEEILAQGQVLAESLGIAVTSRAELNHSTVSDTILEVADEVDADLIVIGTRGETAIEDGLLGSVSNAVVHHARRPVLVVPAHGDAG